MEQTRDPRNNPHFYGQLIYDKARVYNWEETVFSINGIGKTGQLHAKLNSKRITDLYLRSQIIAFLKENIVCSLTSVFVIVF